MPRWAYDIIQILRWWNSAPIFSEIFHARPDVGYNRTTTTNDLVDFSRWSVVIWLVPDFFCLFAECKDIVFKNNASSCCRYRLIFHYPDPIFFMRRTGFKRIRFCYLFGPWLSQTDPIHWLQGWNHLKRFRQKFETDEHKPSKYDKFPDIWRSGSSERFRIAYQNDARLSSTGHGIYHILWGVIESDFGSSLFFSIVSGFVSCHAAQLQSTMLWLVWITKLQWLYIALLLSCIWSAL